jgi:hypothetical protein
VSNVTVETGLSNDSYTEIVSGLTEGQEIIVSTTTAGSTTNTTDQRGEGGFMIQEGMPGPMEFQSGGEFPGGGMAPPGQ